MNFLTETIQAIGSLNKGLDEIIWIGSRDGAYEMEFSEFREFANREYDEQNEFLGIPGDFVIVFTDKTYLERRFSEKGQTWCHQTPVNFTNMLLKPKPITKLVVAIDDDDWNGELGYLTIKQLNPGS